MRASWAPELIRADIGVLVQRVPDAQGLQLALEPRLDFLGDRLLDQQAGAGAADMTLVEKDAIDDAFDGLVDRRRRRR